MDMELMQIQMKQDFEELAEQYEGAAENESIWASGAKTREMIEMHLQNAAQNREMAELYHRMAKYPEAILKLFEED
jgi:hypothetical protein